MRELFELLIYTYLYFHNVILIVSMELLSTYLGNSPSLINWYISFESNPCLCRLINTHEGFTSNCNFVLLIISTYYICRVVAAWIVPQKAYSISLFRVYEHCNNMEYRRCDCVVFLCKNLFKYSYWILLLAHTIYMYVRTAICVDIFRF